MTRSIRQPSLAELTDRMIAAKLSAPVADAGEHEVEPYEVMNGFRTDPRTAYTEATAAAKLLGISGQPTTLPPEWEQAALNLPTRSKARLISDFVSGQTDRYALAEHRRLFDETPELR